MMTKMYYFEYSAGVEREQTKGNNYLCQFQNNLVKTLLQKYIVLIIFIDTGYTVNVPSVSPYDKED